MWKKRTQWYCFTDDERGPFSLKQLAKMYCDGELISSDLIRSGRLGNWQVIIMAPEFLRAKWIEYRRRHFKKLRRRERRLQYLFLKRSCLRFRRRACRQFLETLSEMLSGRQQFSVR